MRCCRSLAARIALATLTVLLGSVLAGTLARYAPGYGTDERLLDARLSHQSVEAIRQEAAQQGNTLSCFSQAFRKMLRLDFGTSRTLHRPVRALLAERGVVTLRLVAAGLSTAWIAALALLLTTWLVDSSALDVTSLVGSGALLCLPAGAVSLLLVLADGPAYLALALVVFPKAYRYLRNLARMAERMPHIVTARAQGTSAARILLYHIVPIIRAELLALAGVSVGIAIGAAIPVEALSGTPGLGQLAWQAALGRDLPVLLAVSVSVIACTVLANSGADLLAYGRVPAV